jgi:hypothetical protein
MNIELFGTGEPPIRKVRKIIFSNAGGVLKGRYAGRSTWVFGESELQITKKLKFFDGGQQDKHKDGTLPHTAKE